MATLFLAADADHLIPSVEQATFMLAQMPSAPMRVLHGHGHGCFLAPDLDLDAILNEWGNPWLRDVATGLHQTESTRGSRP